MQNIKQKIISSIGLGFYLCTIQLGLLLPLVAQNCDYVDNIYITATGFTEGLNIEQFYLLVDPLTGTILDTSQAGIFDPADDANYDLYALNYNMVAYTPTITLNTTLLSDLSTEVSITACGDLVGPQTVTVCAPDGTACAGNNSFFNIATQAGSWNLGNEQAYLLTDATGTILQVSYIPSFPTMSLTVGSYYVYAINYDAAFDPTLTTSVFGATSLNDPIFTNSCVAITPSGLPQEGIETIIELCCDADGGNLNFNILCPEDTFKLVVVGNLIDPNYESAILIADENNVIIHIEDITTTNNLSILDNPDPNNLDWSDLLGVDYTYTFYSYNASTFPILQPDPPPTIGNTIATIGDSNSDFACFNLAPPGGVTHYVPDTIYSFNKDVSIANNGGVTPFFYQNHEIIICGGTPPYDFNISRSGYVRYRIDEFENGFIHPTDPDFNVAAPKDGAHISIIYSTHASWVLDIVDSRGCTEPHWSFTNNFSSQDTVLNIQNHTIIGTTTADVSDGSVSVNIHGGCPPYTYEWYGPQGYASNITTNATTQSISNLHYGWYSLSVSDSGPACGADQQIVEGWSWVPPQRAVGSGGFVRGKHQLTPAYSLHLYPNPIQESTTIEFSTITKGHALVSLFNIEGKLITNLFDDVVDNTTAYQIPFSANGLPNGIYIVQLLMDNGAVKQQKLVIAQ